jgi:hypothetical protein
MKSSFDDPTEWAKFRHLVHEAYPHFFENLAKMQPHLSKNEIKMCALVLFETSISRIAETLGITQHGATVASGRVARKCGLANGEALYGYLMSLTAPQIT